MQQGGVSLVFSFSSIIQIEQQIIAGMNHRIVC
jgi:hypothetical protein